jgi:hypothetical protein
MPMVFNVVLFKKVENSNWPAALVPKVCDGIIGPGCPWLSRAVWYSRLNDLFGRLVLIIKYS